MQSNLLGGVFKCTVALIAEKPIRPAQTTDYQVRKSIIVEIAPSRARRLTDRFSQVSGLSRHVCKMSLPVVAKQLADSLLRHEEIEASVVIEITEHRPDFSRSEGDSRIFRQDKLLAIVDKEHPCAGAV